MDIVTLFYILNLGLFLYIGTRLVTTRLVMKSKLIPKRMSLDIETRLFMTFKLNWGGKKNHTGWYIRMICNNINIVQYVPKVNLPFFCRIVAAISEKGYYRVMYLLWQGVFRKWPKWPTVFWIKLSFFDPAL